MNHILKLGMFAAFAVASHTVSAQNIKIGSDTAAPYIMTSADTLTVGYNAGFGTLAVASNASDYTVTKKTTDADWVSFRKEANGNLTFFTTYYYDNINPRYAQFVLSSADGTFSRTVVVCQAKNQSASTIGGDTQLTIGSATASSSQSGEGIERTYDGKTSTLWHSPYSGGSFPYTLTYKLKEASHVDYLMYTPVPTTTATATSERLR